MSRRLLTTTLILAFAAAGCTAPAQRGALRVGAAVPGGATLRVHVGKPAGFALRYLSTADWEEAVATLSQGVTTIATDTVPAARADVDGSRTATFTFTGIPAGAGYTLDVRLKRRDATGTLVECGSTQNAAVTLAEGANTITLPAAAFASEAVTNPGEPADFVASYVGSWPLVGPEGRFGHPQDAVVSADGTLYVSDPDRDAILAIGNDGLISVLAGGGAGYVDGPGVDARFDDPWGLLIVGTWLYVADRHNHAIRRIDLSAGDHVVETFAGTGDRGWADGAGDNAQFSAPVAITGGADGIFYVADKSNHRIRRLDATGLNVIVSTFAGDGTEGFADAAAIQAQFDHPTGVALGVDVLYVADLENFRVRTIPIDPLDGSPGSVTTLAGDGVAAHLDGAMPNARFLGPSDVAYDPVSTLLYVADTVDKRVRSVTTVGAATVATYAGTSTTGWRDGAAASARFTEPFGLSLGTAGLVVTDMEGARIRAIADDGGGPLVSTLAGDGIQGVLAGVALDVVRPVPSGVALDADDVPIVTDAGTDQLWRVPAEGAAAVFAGSGTAGFVDGAPGVAKFRDPKGIVRRADGQYFVADEGNDAIRLVDAAGNVTTYAGTGAAGDADGDLATATFRAPWGLAIDDDGALWVTETCGRVRRITEQPGGAIDVVTVAGANAAGFVEGAGGVAGPARFDNPRGIEAGGDGAVYVVDANNHRIRLISQTAPDTWTVSTLAGEGTADFADGAAATARFKDPRDIARGPDGALWVADGGNRRVRRLVETEAGWTVSTAAGSGEDGYLDGPGAQARIRDPYALVFTPGGILFVADNDNGWLRTVRF